MDKARRTPNRPRPGHNPIPEFETRPPPSPRNNHHHHHAHHGKGTPYVLPTGGHVGDQSNLIGRVDDGFERTGSVFDLGSATHTDGGSPVHNDDVTRFQVWTPFSGKPHLHRTDSTPSVTPLQSPVSKQDDDTAHADPWMSIAMNTKEVHQKIMMCKEGHTLTEVSAMCDVCHGRGPNRTDTTATSPVFFCPECLLILCDTCCTNVACALNHPTRVIRLQLLCDSCEYTSPFGTEKRMDPHREGVFITQKHFFEKKKYPKALWEKCEVYKPRSRAFYGCRSCDYDICSKCAEKRLEQYRNISGSVVVSGTRVHIMTFRVNPRRRESVHSQLLNQARVAIPAVLNLLYLRRSTKRACLYFGRYDAFGNTVGIPCVSHHHSHSHHADVPHRQKRREEVKSYIEHLRAELLRILMHDIWPPLRVDTPSQSRALKNVISSDMQALVWIKPVGEDRVYVKIVLQNIPYLYFDNAISGEDKHRWKNRRLHVRHLDNLETEKAVNSYEIYLKAFENACRWARHLYAAPDFFVKHIKTSNVNIGCRDDGCTPGLRAHLQHPTAPSVQTYRFAQRLFESEDVSLDYKSYWVDPMSELLQNVPKFMAGFANAYGSGKLLVGVFEVHRRELSRVVEKKDKEKGTRRGSVKSCCSSEEDDSSDRPTYMRAWAEHGDTYPPEEWLEYHGGEDRAALVLGISLTKRDLASLTKGISSSLRKFIPPMPPDWVTLKLHPVKPPTPWKGAADATVAIVLFAQGGFNMEKTVNTLRAQAHKALRSLLPFGLALVPITYQPCLPKAPEEHSALYYVVVRGDSAQAAPQCFVSSTLKQFRHTGEWSEPPKPEWRLVVERVMASAHCSIVEMQKYVAIFGWVHLMYLCFDSL